MSHSQQPQFPQQPGDNQATTYHQAGHGQQPGYAQQPHPGQQPGYAQQPPKRKKPLFKRWWFWLLIIIVIIAISSALNGGGSDSADSSSGDSAQQGDEGQKDDGGKKDEKKDEPDKTYGLGDTFEVDGWQVTITDVKDGIDSVGDEYLGSTAQGQYVQVGVSVKNTSSEAQYFFEDNVKLGDDKGNTYSSDSSAAIYADGESMLITEINPGNTAKGALIFDVPKDVSPDRLLFEGGIFSDPIEVSLK